MLVIKLRETSTVAGKTALLKQASSLDLKMFRYACSKQISFGVKFTKVGTVAKPTDSDFTLLDKLATRELSGRAARDAITNHCAEHGDLVKLICNKALRCGVTAVSINKVWPGCVPLHVVQLAKEQSIANVKLPCYAELKYDGVRITIIKSGDSVKFFTRNGNSIVLPRLTKVCLRSSKDWVLDTEVTYRSGKSEDRTAISGEVNSALKGGLVNEAAFLFNVFDWLPLHEFNAQECTQPYLTRRLQALAVLTTLQYTNFAMAKTTRCSTTEAIEKLFEAYVAGGYEGLILKQPQALYEYKRSASWTKVKEVLDADLVCIAVEEGKGKYLGMIGALVCEGTVSGKAITVRVGSGLTDADRLTMPSAYIGQVVEVKYNTIICDKVTQVWSLFLPRFMGIRFDK